MRSEVRHIFRTERPTNLKLGTLMEHVDPYHQQAPWPSKSKVKVARSRGPSGSGWPISRERKIQEIPKLVGKLPTRRAITSTRFGVKRSKVKVTRLINAETESVSPTKFILGWRLEHPLSTAMASCYKSLWSYCTRAGEYHVVFRNRQPHNLLKVKLQHAPSLSRFWIFGSQFIFTCIGSVWVVETELGSVARPKRLEGLERSSRVVVKLIGAWWFSKNLCFNPWPHDNLTTVYRIWRLSKMFNIIRRCFYSLACKQCKLMT